MMANGIRRRENVAGMDSDHRTLRDYATAVERMKQLPVTDPRSWTQQAAIHLNFCPHGNWFFLPWHRAYLLAFEDICRDMSGNPDFALPYWNWTQNRSIPGSFWTGTLLDSSRLRGPNDQLPTNFVGQPIIDRILRQTEFELFASFKPQGQDSTDARWQRASGGKSELERTPHDQTHVWINGNMVTLRSPLDPIFWLHHCNIDRLWAEWNARGNRNTSDGLWTGFPFLRNFVDRGGNTIDQVVGNLQDVAGLGYTYDSLPQAGPELLAADQGSPLAPLLERTTQRFTRIGPRSAGLREEVSFSVQTPESAVEQTAEAGLLADAAGEGAPRVLAFIRGVKPPTDEKVTVNVFLNCPYLSADTPPSDPHYVGNFTFFGLHGAEDGGHGHHHHHGDAEGGHEMKLDFAFDLTDAVDRLRTLEPDLEQQLTVQLIPLPHPGRDVPPVEIKVDGVEIVYV
jgi:tyrosinase